MVDVVGERRGAGESADPRVLKALFWLSGGLRASARDTDVIRFTGDWAYLGETTVGQILDDANALIGDLIGVSVPIPAQQQTRPGQEGDRP